MNYETTPSYIDKHSAGLATASLVMGILSLVLGCCIYPAFVFGSLAIIFALLSRGGEMKISPNAKVGMILGIVALILASLLIILSFYTIFVEFGGFDNYMKAVEDMMQQMYPDSPQLYDTF
ncbi:MAG: DUF4190 domain-containing protein [Lachnospiraceae bacterium]